MLPGVHRVRRSLASGMVSVHWYAWRGGPSILHAVAHPTAIEREVAKQQAEAARRFHKLTASAEKAAEGYLSGLVTAYLASPEFAGLGERTRRDRKKHLLTARDDLGDMPLAALPAARTEFIEWRNRYADRPRTADHYLDAVAGLLSWARDQGRITADPLAKWPRLYRVDRSEVIWEPQEIEAICAKAEPDLRRAILLAVSTGLRQADLLGLSWADVKGDDIVRLTRKRKRIVRIPITADARAVLDACAKDSVRVLVRDGQPWKVSTLEKRFSLARKAAAEKTPSLATKRWHDFRGTFATSLIAAGVDPAIVDGIMGWAKGSSEQMRARYVGSKAVSMAVVERLRRLPGSGAA